MTPQFEPMTVGGILDRTFRLYRDNFVRFIAIVAVVYVPLGLVSVIAVTLVVSHFESYEEPTALPFPAEQGFTAEPGQAEADEDVAPGMGTGGLSGTAQGGPPPEMLIGLAAVGLVAMFFLIVGTFLCNGALIKSVSEAYLGRQSTVSEAYRFVLPKIGTLIWASIMVGVVVAFGLLLCIVPGIIFALWFAVSTPAIVAENLKAREGLSRSKALASGNLGKVFGVMFVAGIITSILGRLFEWGGEFLTTAMELSPVLAVSISQFFMMIGQMVAVPITAIATILLYYDLRIRKEGFDLEMMAQSLAVPEARRVDWPVQ